MTAQQPTRNTVRNQPRHAERRRIRRRKMFFERALVTVAPESFTLNEAVDFLLGSLTEAKRALKRALRRQALVGAGPQALLNPIQNDPSFPKIARPVYVLSRLNRSSIFPPLVPTKMELGATNMIDILAALRRDYRTSPPHRLLDAFATASGFAWENSAKILFAHKLISTPIDPDDVAATYRARTFWDLYAQGRARYAALVAQGKITQLQGDWACFEHPDFEILLPDTVIPRRLKRYDYLTNWIADGDASTLDVYAGLTCTPLFQHRFLNKFNPLFFGKWRPQLSAVAK